MKPREVGEVALRVLAIYVFLQFLEMLPTGLGVLQLANARHEIGAEYYEDLFPFAWMAAWLFSVAFVYLGLSGVAFFGARRLSRFLVPNGENEASLTPSVSKSLRLLVFQLLGVYALIHWTPALLETTVRCVIYGTWTDPQLPLLRRFYENWSVLISPIVGVLAGLALLFRPSGLLRLIQLSRPMSEENLALGSHTDENMERTGGATSP